MTKKHDIIWLDHIDSTNDEAARRISGLDNLSVLSARTQSAGRGQRQNIWLSEPEANLTFSIILKPADFMAKDQIAISAVTAISIVELLAKYNIPAEIKWPNDIYVGNDKISGILIEHSIKGRKISHSIIGIGLNINQCNFDVSIPNPTSMAQYLRNLDNKFATNEEKIDIQVCLDEYIDIFKKNLCHHINEDRDFTSLRTIYMSMLRPSDNFSEEITRAWQQ